MWLLIIKHTGFNHTVFPYVRILELDEIRPTYELLQCVLQYTVDKRQVTPLPQKSNLRCLSGAKFYQTNSSKT